MSTAPWSPTAEYLTTESIGHIWRVQVQPVSGSAFDLDIESGQLTFDESWSPHVGLELTTAIPEDQALLDALDPRTGCRITLAVGYRYQTGVEDVHQITDLALLRRPVRRPSNTMELTAVSDELRAQETPAYSLHTPPSAGVGEALQWAITNADPTAVIDIGIPTDYRPELLADLALSTGDAWWSIITNLADVADLWVYVDGTRTWRVRFRPTNAGSVAAAFRVGPGGQITESSTELDREEWANVVMVRHKWKNAMGEDRARIGLARVTSGPMSVTTAGTSARVLDRITAISQAGADRAAATILQRTITRGRRMEIQAPATYWVRPGHTTTVQLPTGPQERHLVASVAYRYPSGGMTVTTRQPENVTIETGE